MYRLLSASKDTYVTNKYITGERVVTSNVGQAGTMDLFKLFDETIVPGVTSSVVELSHGLIHFDYANLVSTNPLLNFSDPTFKCFLNLKNVYGGQTTPSNFTLEVLPLSNSFVEGRGSDVIAYRDIDVSNYLSSSVGTSWVMSGASATGSLGDTCDVVVSGNLQDGLGSRYIGATQDFLRGDEDLNIDITHIVSASLAGILANNGLRISFTEALEQDTNTYFVKRFGTRQAYTRCLQPRLIVKSTGDILQDSSGYPQLNVSQSLFVYNRVNDAYVNFFSGSASVTGSNSIVLKLETSKSFYYTTSSFSVTHNATISHLTKSIATWTSSFYGNQLTSSNGIAVPGVYKSDCYVSTFDQNLRDYLSGSNSVEMKISWKSLDDQVVFASNYATFTNPQGSFTNLHQRNIVTNITNLSTIYKKSFAKSSRLRVFTQDYDITNDPSKLSKQTLPQIFTNMFWRLKETFTKKIVIPFDETTRLSYDGEGMYFDIWMSDLDVGEVYQIDLSIGSIDGSSEQTLIENSGFRFKVVD